MKRYHTALFSVLILFVSFFLFACKEKKEKTVYRSFYFWKSVFKLQPKEAECLQKFNIKTLYVKFFDVVWNNEQKKPEPVAQINFVQLAPPTISITPVIFITNETLQQLSLFQADTLSNNMIKLLKALSSNPSLHLSREIQIDCDWSAGTKDKYFQLLNNIKKDSYCNDKIISATIRLHQLKFINETGIPPVDKGLLMCYNMGNLRHPETVNSIIEPDELKKYVKRLSLYPLKLDVALPIFDWWVWFRHEQYKGLIHSDQIQLLSGKLKTIVFEKDTMLDGINFEKDDWLRYENSPTESLYETARILRENLQSDSINIILYHLDEKNLSKYATNELENFFDGFR